MKPVKGGQGPVWAVAPLIIIIISISKIYPIVTAILKQNILPPSFIAETFPV
jgi:hypothetical protein